MNLDDHPCFNRQAHRRFGRVHLPVAPRCNIQCKFCNRLFDCVNESRPGVTSAVLSPGQAMVYLAKVLHARPEIRVVGIAGPGDPFANPVETLETLALVRRRHPEMILCVATNGLNLPEYVDDLARLGVSHVTVTLNAVDPLVGARIYSWMRIGKQVVRAEQGAARLLERQLAGIDALRARGIRIKVNSILLPGVNGDHIANVAREAGRRGADLFNVMPYYPCAGSAFAHLAEPSAAELKAVRARAGRYLPQMRHCTRCRADAAGLLGEAPAPDLMAALQACRDLYPGENPPAGAERPYVAVASREGVLVNQHLGEAARLLIYGLQDGAVRLVDSRDTPLPGGGARRWRDLAGCIGDCRALLAGRIGDRPRQVLTGEGIRVLEIEGLIEEAVRAVLAGENMRHMTVRPRQAGGGGCAGGAAGCG